MFESRLGRRSQGSCAESGGGVRATYGSAQDLDVGVAAGWPTPLGRPMMTGQIGRGGPPRRGWEDA